MKNTIQFPKCAAEQRSSLLNKLHQTINVTYFRTFGRVPPILTPQSIPENSPSRKIVLYRRVMQENLKASFSNLNTHRSYVWKVRINNRVETGKCRPQFPREAFDKVYSVLNLAKGACW